MSAAADLRVPARLDTPRLTLRTWRRSDWSAFAAINADPRVMEHLGGIPMRRVESDALADRIEDHWHLHGYGLYAVDLRATRRLAGFIGLNHHRAMPDQVEIGWRLAHAAWGQGLATEGACAVRDLAYDTLGLSSLISITIAANTRSLRVMEKLGLSYWQQMAWERWWLTIYRGTPTARSDTRSRGSEAAR
ncbi:GNAT family N-acetyltransferase [Actinopolymorpha sp. B9G3]|uniref:GNAT family N-acetyltransferase n=1 Tax=Actinopolymorpha sp. B9G3 TaxID=3158970 RepID=UPI0032D8CA52